MLRYKEFDSSLNNTKDDIIATSNIKSIYPEFLDRDLRIIRLDFEGDIAQFIVKKNSLLIKLYPIASVLILDNPNKLIILNSDNNEVKEFCSYIELKKNKINSLNIITFLENILSFHSEKLDKKIKVISNQIGAYSLENIESKDLTKIAKIFHDLLILKNQYEEIQQTLTQANEISSQKLNQIEDFSRTINIYQNEFEEDVKTLSRMVKEIEILVQMTEIKFADKRNNIALTSLNLDVVVLVISFISMFGSIFGMNLNSSLEVVKYGLYFILLIVFIASFIFLKLIKNFILYSICN